MRSKPEVELRMSRTVHPGDAVLVELTLQSRSETPVYFIELTLDGSELSRLEGQIAAPRHFLSLLARVTGEGTLGPGEHRYRVSFPLPADAPCTYVGARAEIRYALKLKVAIPWWFDVDESYEVRVTPRSLARPPRAPLAGTTARGDEPFVEVALEDQVFGPGDEITGAVALGNVRGRRVRALELSLVGFERLRPAGDRAIEALRYTAFLQADARDEGRELPFRFKIPDAVPTSFDAGWVALFWGFEVRVTLARAPDVVHVAPITLAVLDRPAAAPALRRRIGSGRWRAVWEAVGAQHRLSLDPLELRLTGALSGCAAAAWIGASPAGAALVGELRWPSWGLDLQIGLRRLHIGRPLVDDEQFTSRYRVRGRDPAQVRAVLGGPLRRALLAFDEVRLDDTRVTVWSRTPGHDQPWLGVFLDHLAALAAELAAASARIPPPASMAAARPAWEAFAREVRGQLTVGRMSIRDAQIEGAVFHVETCFERSAAPDRTEITLALDPPLEAPLDVEDPEALRASAPAIQELVRAIRAEARALRVDASAVVITLPAPLEDPASAREFMGAALLLAQRLRGLRGVGPYR